MSAERTPAPDSLIPPTLGATGGIVEPTITVTPGSLSAIIAANDAATVVVAGYEMLGLLGRGGMGVVYKARQTKLNRLVALKMILAASHADGQEHARFLAEAEVIARMQHPNIVQIFETGQHEGLPYFSLEFIDGGSLAARLDGTPLTPTTAACLVEALARGIHYAHERGVVHRDLKPANVLLAGGDAPLDQCTPKITDFGLAKQVESDSALTRTGAVMGTPQYMSPEQADGRVKDIGPATDVYALGAILYQCLTGRPPFRGASIMETLRQVMSHEPVAPTQLQPKTPRDLETICLKCLHKEPARRYASALELAEDLRRFQTGEPIRARPVGKVERCGKWMKRHPGVTAALAAVTVVTVVAAILVGWQYHVAVIERDKARTQHHLAVENAREASEQKLLAEGNAEQYKTQKELAERTAKDLQVALDNSALQLANSKLLLAQAAWREHQPAVALDRLDEVPPKYRGWEWQYLDRRYHGGLLTLYNSGPVGNPSPSLASVAYSPDGRVLATGDFRGVVRLWDARTGTPLSSFAAAKNTIESLAFSPDGTQLATGSDIDPAPVKLWEVATGRLVKELRGPQHSVLRVVFSPDGQSLAVADFGKTVSVWDIASGKDRFPPLEHQHPPSDVAFSPDGLQLATCDDEAVIRFWDARQGTHLRNLGSAEVGSTEKLSVVAFSPDGTRLATGGSAGTVMLWETATRTKQFTLAGHTARIKSVVFSADGLHLASSSLDKTVRVWDAQNGKSLATLQGHRSDVWSAAFSPDGRLLASASLDGTAKIWDVRGAQDAFAGNQYGVLAAVFSPNGEHFATACRDGQVRLFDTRSRRLVQTFSAGRDGETGQSLEPPVLVFSPNSRFVAAAAGARTIGLRDADTGQLVGEFHAGQKAIVAAAFSADGGRLIAADLGKTVTVWDVESGKVERSFALPESLLNVLAFSYDGRRAASATTRHTLAVWDIADGRVLCDLPHPIVGAQHAAFSPDGTRVVSTLSLGPRQTRGVLIWDVDTGRLLPSSEGHTDAITAVTFSPDGRRVASASLDQTVKLWDVDSGNELVSLPDFKKQIWALAFNTKRPQLAVGGNDSDVKLWDAHDGQVRCVLEERFEPWQGYVFNAAGDRIAARNREGKVRVWDAHSGKVLHTLNGQSPAAVQIAFSQTGDWITDRSDKGNALYWNTTTGEPMAKPDEDRVFPPSGVSPDGKTLAAQDRASGRLIDLRPPEGDETISRLALTAPDVAWHRSEARRAEQAGQWYTAAFHYYRVELLEPWTVAKDWGHIGLGSYADALRDRDDWRLQAVAARLALYGGNANGCRELCANLTALNREHADAALRRAAAQICLLVPKSATDKKPLPDLKPLLDAAETEAKAAKNYEDVTLYAGLLLRSNRPNDAVGQLEKALSLRVGTPTVREELLLAIAYAQLDRPDEARRWLGKAVSWLSGERIAVQAGDSLLSGTAGPLPALTALQTVTCWHDPRAQSLSWQTWVEMQALRYEAETLLRR